MSGKLYLVSTPIGNYDDITLRALETLKTVDFVVCEEYKEGRRLLAHYGIEKELFSVNEHNEAETAAEVLDKILEGQSAALVSDGGAPLFSDPGHLLTQICIDRKVDIVPIPGANSLIPALTASGFDSDRFYFYGWLSPKSDIRRKELFRLKNTREVIVIMETPYRLISLLTDIVKMFGPNVQCCLAYEITMKREHFYRGPAGDVLQAAKAKSLKGEFVLILDNKKYY
jgi:16S rRNA (cytidine1402-2'-O)-methyltransferase